MDNWEEKLENELKLKGYSRQTLKNYKYHTNKFVPSKKTPREFLLNLINQKKANETIRSVGFAIKFYLQILKNAAKKTNIQKKITPYTLRHSFATHLLENGIDIRHIRDLLGHSNNTTLIYTKVSNRDISKIKSPINTN